MPHRTSTPRRTASDLVSIVAIIDCLVSRDWEGLRFEMVDFAESYPGSGDGGSRLVADIYGVGNQDISTWTEELCSLASAGRIAVHDFRGEHTADDIYQPDISVVFEGVRTAEDLDVCAEQYEEVKSLPDVIRRAIQDLHRRERRQKMAHLRSLSYMAV